MLNKLSKLFFWLFLISLPFGFRVLVFQFTPGFDEYEAVFLYASDVLMVLFLFFFSLNLIQTKPALENQNLFPRRGKSSFPSSSLVPISSEHPARSGCGIFSQTGLVWLFVLFLFISIFFASYKLLALYNFIRLVLLVLTALAIAEILKRNLISLEKILVVLAGSAFLQSLIAFLQFLNQKSLGLGFLGESVLGPEIVGAAKISVAGGRILRAYGTFPHPNVLAAFLLLGLFSLYYFLLGNNNLKKRFRFKLLVLSLIFLISLGLVLTFSRTAWALGIFLTLLYIFLSKNYRRQARYPLIILIFIFFFILLIMGWLIFPRAQISLGDPAVSQRLAYNELSWSLIKTHPFGIGLGNQVIYSVKNGIYQLFGMNQVWQWQPIHNIYLLIGSEVGILGLMAFLMLAIKILITNIKFLIFNKNLEISSLSLVTLIMFLSLLGFGLVDHFLWTLQPGRLMFWLVLGIMLGTSPRS